MQSLYYSGQHRLCIKLVRSEGQRFEKDSTLYRNYWALSERGIGNMKSFYKIMEHNYKSRPYNGSLVSSRDTFKNLLGDNKLLEILTQFHSAEEISALMQSVEQDKKHKEIFEQINQTLGKHIKCKISSVTSSANAP
jgi:succinate dehydrogenase/fumarate reductase flavoprotein subunit